MTTPTKSQNKPRDKKINSDYLMLNKRLRRLRRTPAIRELIRETRLATEDLVYPLFVCEGKSVRQEVPSMPGVFQLSVDAALQEASAAQREGIRAVLLFGVPLHKDDSKAPVQSAVRAIKEKFPDLLVITDVCLCSYTSHGHCGIVEENEVMNDPTVVQLALTAISHAQAGADIVAPSDMMDGRVSVIRESLDEAGFSNTAIMSYAAKYCSAYYGPFRDAANSSPSFGDRQTYQMDPANAEEALREVALDLEEGADIVMIKPALHYLDVISRIKDEFACPTAAYHVSGEYAMLKAAAQNGWIDENKAMIECLTSIKRAGADIIISYYAREAAKTLA